jgi:hypothetical protein
LSLLHRKPVSSKLPIAAAALIVLLCAAGARADKVDIIITNATFSATCIGGASTCTEVVNGSLLIDTAAQTVIDASMQLTGTLNANLVLGTVPQCVSPGCLGGSTFYDSGVLPSHDPIEFGLVLNSAAIEAAPNTPSPVSLVGLQPGNPTVLYVPALCGGDQPDCNAPGAFPGGNDADYALVSGTYSTVDETTPEPSSVVLVTAAAMLGFLIRRLPSRTENLTAPEEFSK